jgi:hypothetical protein
LFSYTLLYLGFFSFSCTYWSCYLWMCFWWYSFIITFWGYFVILEGCFVILEGCFVYICNVLLFSYTLLYLGFFSFSCTFCIYWSCYLWMCFWWYSFIITFWGYFVILEGCFVYICNVLLFSYTLKHYKCRQNNPPKWQNTLKK